MNKIISILITTTLISVLSTGSAKSENSEDGGKLGIGVSFSGITALSIYADTSNRNFIQTAIGFATGGSYSVTGDYAFGYRNAISSLPSFTPYLGFGAIFLNDQSDYWSRYSRDNREWSTYYGLRIPLGINWAIPKTPIQLGAEIAPTLLVHPRAYTYTQGCLNARLLF